MAIFNIILFLNVFLQSLSLESLQNIKDRSENSVDNVGNVLYLRKQASQFFYKSFAYLKMKRRIFNNYLPKNGLKKKEEQVKFNKNALLRRN